MKSSSNLGVNKNSGDMVLVRPPRQWVYENHQYRSIKLSSRNLLAGFYQHLLSASSLQTNIWITTAQLIGTLYYYTTAPARKTVDIAHHSVSEDDIQPINHTTHAKSRDMMHSARQLDKRKVT